MSLAITIELGDADLAHFIERHEDRAGKAKNLSGKEITDAAMKLLEDGSSGKVPGFIAERLSKIGGMIAMVNDEGFGMDAEDRQRVLACLTYFANPKDLIPGQRMPVLGFLDDAIHDRARRARAAAASRGPTATSSPTATRKRACAASIRRR